MDNIAFGKVNSTQLATMHCVGEELALQLRTKLYEAIMLTEGVVPLYDVLGIAACSLDILDKANRMWNDGMRFQHLKLIK